MKKFLIAGLAVLTIFAMTTMVVGCGGGDDDDDVKITFDLDGGKLNDATVVTGSPFTIPKGTSLGDDFPVGTPVKEATPEVGFAGWYNGSSPVTKDTEFSGNATVKATYAVLITVTFDKDADDATVTGKTEYKIPMGTAVMVLPKATRDGYYFAGWYNGDELVTKGDPNNANVGTKFDDDKTVKAKWYSTALEGTDGDADEKLSLENAGLAIYKFALGTATLGDYDHFEITYKVSDAAIALTQTRHRVYGGFSEFVTQQDDSNEGEQADKFDDQDVTGWQEDENGTRFINAPKFNVGDYIIINGGRDLAFSSLEDNKTDGEIEGNTWFTLKYALPTEHDALAETGDVFVGLGLTSNGDPRSGSGYYITGPQNAPIVQLVKDIKLVKADGITSVAATIPGNGEAQFMAYGSPGESVWCWRGTPSADITTPLTVEAPPQFDDPIPATADLDVAALLDIVGFKNDTAWAAAYATLGKWEIPFPEYLDIRSYSKYTVEVIAYDSSGVVITDVGSSSGDGWGLGQVGFHGPGDWNQIIAQYNINEQTTDAEFPETALAQGPNVVSLAIQNSNASVAYLEIVKIIFYK